jgi:hypothetical protein
VRRWGTADANDSTGSQYAYSSGNHEAYFEIGGTNQTTPWSDGAIAVGQDGIPGSLSRTFTSGSWDGEGWNALEPLAMGKFQQWRQQHGGYSLNEEFRMKN